MKSAPAALLTNIAQNVTSFATLITLVRGDGKTLNFTQHDRPITFNGVYFRNDVPYNLSAIDTNSDLSVDTTTLEVAIDGTVFTHRDIGNDAYRGGQIEIALVDWKNLDSGKMVLRQGWFTQVQDNRPNTLSLEIGGLMKVLDMGVGRTYQPTCDADLGDSRCRISLDPSQAYSPLNPVIQGDWKYIYDRTLLTALSGTNLNFETGDITGWEVSDGAAWIATNTLLGAGQIEGSYFVNGNTASTTEQFLAQTFDVSSLATDIDAGNIAFVAFYCVAQLGDLTTTFPRSVVQVYDASGNLIDTKDTRYYALDTADKWRERCQHVNLKPGARTVKIYLYGKTKTGTIAKVGFDRLQPYVYNVTAASPTHNLIFKCVRTPNWAQPAYAYAIGNPGFEQNTRAVSTVEDIASWTKAGSFWGVATTALSGLGPPRDSRYLIAGDNGSNAQSTYTISQTLTFNASWVDLTRLAQGKYVGQFSGIVMYGDTVSQAGVQLEFFKADGVTSLGTIDALELGANAAVASVPFLCTFTFPIGTAAIKITPKAVSPVGVSLAKIGFDGFWLNVADAEHADATRDLKIGFGDAATAFSYTSGTYSQDGNLVWRAFPTLRLVDTVAAVTDRKLFTGTDITGDFGAYETAKIEWLSGANAGRTSLIRTWFPPTKEIKTYFPALNPIAVGDKFIYYPSCQKRFLEDCIFKFNNALNFQGFPYLPGTVAPDTDSDLVNTDAPPSPTILTVTKVAGNASSGTGTTVALKTGIAAGDLLIVVAWNGATKDLPAAPDASWTTAQAVSGTKTAAAVFAKVADAGDVTAGVVTVANATHWCADAATPSVPIGSIVTAVYNPTSLPGFAQTYVGNGTRPAFVYNTDTKRSVSGIALANPAVQLDSGKYTGFAGFYGILAGVDGANTAALDETRTLRPSNWPSNAIGVPVYTNILDNAVCDRTVNGFDFTSVKLGMFCALTPPGDTSETLIMLGGRPAAGGTENLMLSIAVGAAPVQPSAG